MNNLRELIEQLPLADVKQIADDYDVFERDGAIGECMLRTVAEQWCTKIGSSSTAVWMNQFAFEAFRRLARS